MFSTRHFSLHLQTILLSFVLLFFKILFYQCSWLRVWLVYSHVVPGRRRLFSIQVCTLAMYYLSHGQLNIKDRNEQTLLPEMHDPYPDNQHISSTLSNGLKIHLVHDLIIHTAVSTCMIALRFLSLRFACLKFRRYNLNPIAIN